MTVSVIIPAYNAATTIAQALKALSVQDFPEKYEIIVVDDGSTDATAATIKGFAGVIYAHQGNAGPAAARNHGARLAKGRYLCFTDADCAPHPDWISLLVKGFTSPSVGVVCGSYGIANPHSVLARGIHEEILFRHTHLMPDHPKAFGSYNFCVRKEVFDGVNGFSTGYRQASGEDNDLSYKIIASGHKIFFERKALVDHYHTTRVGKYLKEQYRHGFWRAFTYADHPAMAKGDGYTFWKDMAEVPWTAFCVLFLMLSVLYHESLVAAFCFLLLLLVFEIIFACVMLRGIFTKIFFAFVMYLRAFSRTFGLSTGIFHFFMQRWEKKSK